jgi:hypothetical protein
MRSSLLTPSRLENETAGNELDRTGTKRQRREHFAW